MMAASDAVRCYAVADDLVPRPIGTGQFVTAAECEPDAPTLPLPENTNARVNAASEAFRNDISRLLGSMRRRTPGNLRNRNFIKRQINGIGNDIAEPRRLDALREAFAGDLPTVVENELSDLRLLNLGGRELVLRLELLQERYRLNPAARSTARTTSEPTRIVCSDSLL